LPFSTSHRQSLDANRLLRQDEAIVNPEQNPGVEA
jgi:hypothetical protein